MTSKVQETVDALLNEMARRASAHTKSGNLKEALSCAEHLVEMLKVATGAKEPPNLSLKQIRDRLETLRNKVAEGRTAEAIALTDLVSLSVNEHIDYGT